MKHKLVLLALFIAACLTGCATADKLNQLRIGMTEDQVTTLMGKSDSRSAQANIIYLTYYLANDSRVGEQPYAVRLVDGKVESFGRFAQLLDMYNRPVPGSIHATQGYGGLLGGAYTQGATTYTTTQIPNGGGLGSELQKLKVLKDQGVLTEEEFQKAKTKLLDAQK